MNKVFIVFEGNGSYSDRRETPLKAFASFGKAKVFEEELNKKNKDSEAKTLLYDSKLSDWEKVNSIDDLPNKPYSMSRTTWEESAEGMETARKIKEYYAKRLDFIKETCLELGVSADDLYSELDYFIAECELDSTL